MTGTPSRNVKKSLVKYLVWSIASGRYLEKEKHADETIDGD
jgi:hypothetical protein